MEVDQYTNANSFDILVNLKRDFNKNGSDSLICRSLSLHTLLHLSETSLKKFLTKTAKNEEDVESAKDSILGKWALIAKRA